MNQTVFSQELVLDYESWKVLRDIVPYEFLSSMPQSNQKIPFQKTRKVANVHVESGGIIA